MILTAILAISIIITAGMVSVAFVFKPRGEGFYGILICSIIISVGLLGGTIVTGAFISNTTDELVEEYEEIMLLYDLIVDYGDIKHIVYLEQKSQAYNERYYAAIEDMNDLFLSNLYDKDKFATIGPVPTLSNAG